MPRLIAAQWQTMRAAWEASPLRGYNWLTESGGGPWPVSREAVRLRAIHENWIKVQITPAMVGRAHLAADRAMVERADLDEFACTENPTSQMPSAGAFGPVFSFANGSDGTGGAEMDGRDVFEEQATVAQQSGAALRGWLLNVHRQEWFAARRLVHAAMKQADLANGVEKAKLAKIAVDVLKVIQAAESAIYGLDANLIDFGALTDKQLQSVADGRRPR